MKFSVQRILCVDDDEQTSEWMGVVFEESKVDASITIAKTGREALTILDKEDFDLCILEYALPDITGAELCSLMRRMGNDVPMMIFTALDRTVDRQKAETAGANAYLCKPDDLDIFISAVTHLLKRRRPIYAEYTRFPSFLKAA